MACGPAEENPAVLSRRIIAADAGRPAPPFGSTITWATWPTRCFSGRRRGKSTLLVRRLCKPALSGAASGASTRAQHESVALACRGRHYEIGTEHTGPKLCPLSVLETEADVAWAEDWIATCVELQTGKAPNPDQRDAIHRAMVLLRGDDLRSLTHFVALVQDESVRSAMRYYTLDGALGELLDAREDGVADARLTVFEIDELMAMKEQAIPSDLRVLLMEGRLGAAGLPAAR